MLRDAAVAAGAELFQPAEVRERCSARRTTMRPARWTMAASIAARTVIAACGSWNAKGPFAVARRRAAPSDLFAFKAHFPAAACRRA